MCWFCKIVLAAKFEMYMLFTSLINIKKSHEASVKVIYYKTKQTILKSISYKYLDAFN